jgi:hypothetical protein
MGNASMLIAETDLLTKVNEVVTGLGCKSICIGPYANKKGRYGHVYGPSVVLASLRGRLSREEITYIDSQVTERVCGITRVSFQQ